MKIRNQFEPIPNYTQELNKTKCVKALNRQLCSVKSRAKRGKIPFDIDFAYIRLIYEEQRGLCALTGLGLNMTPCKGLCNKKNGRPDALRMSIDRIDPSLGYIKGNIRLVGCHINSIRSDFTDLDTFIICKAFVTAYEKRMADSIGADSVSYTIKSELL